MAGASWSGIFHRTRSKGRYRTQPHLLLTYLKMVATVFQEQLYISKTDSMKIEKVYQLGDQRHIVGRAEFNSAKYSWIVGDITHFVYKKELPPQITWALHMGRILDKKRTKKKKY